MALKSKDDQTLDFDGVIALMDRVRVVTDKHQGQSQNVEGGNNQERTRRNAEISRELLWAAHLLKAAELEMLSQYHVFKGQDEVPLVDFDI
jgi:hypothetical protein